LKTIDMVLPLYGLSAVMALLAFLAAGRRLDPAVIAILVLKLGFDLTCHFLSALSYQRWQGCDTGLRFRLLAVLATLTEPFCFQLFRQLGALLGWVAFLRGRIEWHPQRLSPPIAPRISLEEK